MKKNNKQTFQCTMSNSTTTKTALFDSLLANENQQIKEARVHQFASRVGLVLKVMSNRDLTHLQFEFENALSKLVQDYCEKIDNELSSSKEN